jgi:hypothetical protein
MNLRPACLAALFLCVTPGSTAEDLLPKNLPPPVFNAAQKQALDALVGRIKRAKRESFEKDDWSIMARLYPPGTFDCWTEKYTDGPYSFLSGAEIPDDARYEVGRIENFMFAPADDDSKMGATHYVEINYQKTYLAKCGRPGRKIYPTEYFFVRQRGNEFELAHSCPGDPAKYLTSGFSPRRRMISMKRPRQVVDSMTPAERANIRSRLLAEPVPLNTILDLQGNYGFSDDETYFAIDRICELASQPAAQPR